MEKIIVKNPKLNKLFGKEFEFVNSGFSTGEFNMAYDIERTEMLSNQKALPMFRLYGWKPWAVSLGFNQKIEDIVRAKCNERNIDVVRRPTGGRAVLHADEITYSVILKLREDLTANDAYQLIHQLLLEGLCNLGIAGLEFEKSQPNLRELYKQPGVSIPCFASSARYEIKYQDKKIVGSAQRRFSDVLLQHGSILLGKGHEQLAFLSNSSDESQTERVLKIIVSHSISLSEIAGYSISYEQAAESIKSVILNGNQ